VIELDQTTKIQLDKSRKKLLDIDGLDIHIFLFDFWNSAVALSLLFI